MKKSALALTLLIFLISCSNYYKAVTTTGNPPASVIDKLQSQHKYFILRNGSLSYAISDISFTDNQSKLQCTLAPLPDDHSLYVTNGTKGKLIYQKASAETPETIVLSVVHLYISADTTIVNGPCSLALDKFQKIEVLEKDQQKTKKSHIIGGIFIGGGVLATAVIIAAVAVSHGLSSIHP